MNENQKRIVYVFNKKMVEKFGKDHEIQNNPVLQEMRKEFSVKSGKLRFCMLEMAIWDDGDHGDPCGNSGLWSFPINYKVMKKFNEEN